MSAMYCSFSAARIVVALALLDLVAEQRGDHLVAAHADRAVDAPHRQRVPVRRNARYQAIAWK